MTPDRRIAPNLPAAGCTIPPAAQRCSEPKTPHLVGLRASIVLTATGVLLASLAGCAGSRAGAPVVAQEAWDPAPGLTGLRIQTTHYDLYTTASDGVTLEYLPAFIETAFAEYQKLLAPPAPPARRLPIYLFERRTQWAAFTQELVPHLARVYLHIKQGGYMDPGSGSVVVWDLGRDRSLSLLGHEGLHQYLNAFFPGHVPAWVNEGLATQWESFELRGNRPRFTPRNNYFRRNSLREAVDGDGTWIPLTELVSMHAGQAVVRAGQVKRGYYAQVWALVLFLRESAARPWRRGFQDLLNDVAADRLTTTLRAYRTVSPEARMLSDGEVAFRRYISEDLDRVDSAYKQFALSLVH